MWGRGMSTESQMYWRVASSDEGGEICGSTDNQLHRRLLDVGSAHLLSENEMRERESERVQLYVRRCSRASEV